MAENETQKEEKDRTVRVAIAGLIATATVGLLGPAIGWFIARDDRTSQESRAYFDRVYDRRADAYLAALHLIFVHDPEMVSFSDQLRGGFPPEWEHPPRFKILQKTPANGDVFAGLQAFGTGSAVSAYMTMIDALADFETTWDDASPKLRDTRSAQDREDISERLRVVLTDAHRRYIVARDEFFRQVNMEVG